MTSALYQPFPMETAARAQVWRHAPRYLRPRHFHPEPELNLVAAGTGTFGAGDGELAVGAGDLLWWAPGQDHELLGCSDDFDLFVVGVTPELSDRVLGSSVAPLAGAMRVRLAPGDLARFRESCAAVAGSSPDGAEGHVGDLWHDANALRISAADKHALTRRALLSLLGEPALTRDDLARRARSHPTEVSRHFHHDMGLTLVTYRTRLRLLRFIRAVDGGSNLLDAALEAGFGSYSQCHRAFHRTLGCGPRVFFGTSLRREMGDACR